MLVKDVTLRSAMTVIPSHNHNCICSSPSLFMITPRSRRYFHSPVDFFLPVACNVIDLGFFFFTGIEGIEAYLAGALILSGCEKKSKTM